jgi:BMFP domain-containing protein YqiC
LGGASHISEKLARLDFVTRETQNTLASLQREREMAERIEHGIKQLRSRSMPVPVESKTA